MSHREGDALFVEDRPEPERHRHLLRDVVLPGGLAGVLGGVVMLIATMAISAIALKGAWLPPRLVAGFLFRDGPPTSVIATAVGLALHLAVAGGFGTLFALLLPRRGTAVAAIGFGILFGLSLQVAMPAFVIPYTSRELAREGGRAALFLGHVGFGAALALVPALRRGLVTLDHERIRVRHYTQKLD